MKRFIQKRIAFYVSYARPSQSQFDPQFQRLRRKFGTIYAVLCLAAELGVLALDRTTVRKALLACERDHILLQLFRAYLSSFPPTIRHK